MPIDAENVTSFPQKYPAEMLEDLRRSGLDPGDLRSKPMGPAEKQATMTPLGVEGYVIPYFDMLGRVLPFYRVRLFGATVKYRQLADTPNHVYFPPRLPEILPGAKFILITEGEKKAAAAVKAGIPCVAFGGVDSWRSRTIALPKESELATKKDGKLSVKLPQGASTDNVVDTIAHGLQQLVDVCVLRNIPLIVAYDTEVLPNGRFGVKIDVQRAAASLGFELRHRGVPLRNIKQLILPAIPGEDKTGLDDLIVENGAEQLRACISDCLRTGGFPRHPNPKSYVNKQLQRPNMPRASQMALSLAILTDLDCRGRRLRSPDEDALYYFSSKDKSLTKAEFTGRPEFSKTSFGQRLYRDYNIGLNDQRVMGWLGTQFAAEEPIAEVYPEKVLAWRGDVLYYQINDGCTARISSTSIDLVDNGTDEVLFESGLVDGIPTVEFQKALNLVGSQVLDNWWLPVLRATRVKDSEDDRQRKLLALLYYVSPFFYRWRGTQLPVEITTGEAGSGKSTLFQLRLGILTGVPTLRNAPTDLKDWNASLAATGALHVTDNVQLGNSELRQRLSDEICRLVTEPKPGIEQRKLYTDTSLVKIPVRCVFAITAIKQPFQNIDIIQRSVITELDKGISSDLEYDSDWEAHMLASRGGRAVWLAHHLLVVQRILEVIQKEWKIGYKAKYRLINLEQLLTLTARTFGWDDSWVAPFLEGSRDQRAQDADWTLEGLVAFRREFLQNNSNWGQRPLELQELCSWAETHEEFKGCMLLMNARQLARYIGSNKHTVATTAKILLHESGGHHFVTFI